MEEMYTSKSDLPADVKSASSDRTATSLQKIYRKGDKIYQVSSLDENVSVIKEDNDQIKQSNDLTDGKVDEVSSGESLYKTFSFDKDISKEETEKCISFWRSVVEKNLEPIKCTIIENLDNKYPIPKTEKKTKEKSKKQTRKSERQAVKETPKRNRKNIVWYDILEELQKQRLDKTKLMLKQRCRLCEYTSSNNYETDSIKKDIEEHIKELDVWQPRSNKPHFFAGSRSPGEGSSSGSRKKQNPTIHNIKNIKATKQNTISEEHHSKEIIKEVSEEQASNIKVEPETLVIRVKEASNKIKYVDAIEKKKREKIYSKWRQNKVDKTCKCLRPRCDCNTNSAVVAIINDENNTTEDETVENSQINDEESPLISDPAKINTATANLEDKVKLNQEQQVENVEKSQMDNEESQLVRDPSTANQEDNTKLSEGQKGENFKKPENKNEESALVSDSSNTNTATAKQEDTIKSDEEQEGTEKYNR